MDIGVLVIGASVSTVYVYYGALVSTIGVVFSLACECVVCR